MTKKPIIKQFKLSSKEEIICEVVQWDDEESTAIVIRAVLQLIENINYRTGLKLYTFRPWLSFNEDPTILQTLNSQHVVGESSPSRDMLHMYTNCLAKLKKHLKENKNLPPIDLEEFEDMSDEELNDILKFEYEKIIKDDEDFEHDSGGSNIIRFPKTTIH